MNCHNHCECEVYEINTKHLKQMYLTQEGPLPGTTLTSIHSSRMRTVQSCARISPACTAVGVCSGGCLFWRVSGPKGCLLPGGVWSGGVSTPGGCLPLVPGGMYPSMQWGRHRSSPLWTDRHL